MKKILIIAAALFVSASAFAASNTGIDSRQIAAAGFDKLTDVQKIAVIKSVADQAAIAASPVSEDTIDKIDRWSQVGANLGKGLAATAKELGVAVNDFANTPIGQIATFLIIWHIIGASIMHVIGAILVWVLGLIAVRYVFDRAYPAEIKYNLEVRNMFGNHPITKLERPKMNGDAMASFLGAYAIVLGAGVAIMFTM